MKRPGWLPPTSLVLCVLGLLDAAYLTYEHYSGSTSLACSDTQLVNCTKVTTSQWSELAGIPVALLGLLFFIAMTLLCLPVVWRRAPQLVQQIRLGAAAIGLLMVFYLVWAEFFKIHAICLWCTGVHVITFVLLIVLVLGEIFSHVELD
ncbi:vitamin K epoxide reductase family protein [Leekyejoonella antrihumi]|uniref:Vitamin K epoxide reductase family protein n=1 Tax=Leekyejoonella antrihumi TaxID=1660198 RepID=A0A563DW35_9MICO|nr:vitamin K epoxide reductase family protein [Leekyejoonella antrihumi]